MKQNTNDAKYHTTRIHSEYLFLAEEEQMNAAIAASGKVYLVYSTCGTYIMKGTRGTILLLILRVVQTA